MFTRYHFVLQRFARYRFSQCNLLLWLLVLPMSACLPAASNQSSVTPTVTPTTAPTAADASGLKTLLNQALPTSKASRTRSRFPGRQTSITATQTTTSTNSLAALLPTVTPTPRITPTPTSVPPLRAVITAAQVNVRAGPGTNYPVEGKVQSGITILVTGRTETGDWLHICCPVNQGVESWISAEFVLVDLPNSNALAALPVPEIVPPPAAAKAGDEQKSAGDLAAATAPGMPGPGNFPAPSGTNPLTGLGLAADRAGQRPLIVCLNNDYAARPQLGTSQADVVYEYLMEGYGITRFSAIFYGSDASQVGPVRSARLINYYMGGLYDAGVVCSGASDPVRYSLKHEAPFPYMDIDLDDASNTRYSVSLGSDYRTRLRTDTSKLHRWLADWGVEKAASLRGFTFGTLPSGGTPTNSIIIPYPARHKLPGQLSLRHQQRTLPTLVGR